VREIGASNFTADRLKEALDLSEKGFPRYQSLQPIYSLVERDTFEGALEDLCLAENIGVIGFFVGEWVFNGKIPIQSGYGRPDSRASG